MKSILLIKMFLGLVEMMLGLVYASFSLPEWQALNRASDISRTKKAKFRGIFRGKFAEKSTDFAAFSREKSQNSRNNRPISGDFRGRKVKIRRKIGPFRGIFAGENSIFEGFWGANS